MRSGPRLGRGTRLGNFPRLVSVVFVGLDGSLSSFEVADFSIGGPRRTSGALSRGRSRIGSRRRSWDAGRGRRRFFVLPTVVGNDRVSVVVFGWTLEWPACRNVKEVRGFLGTVGPA